MVNSLAWTFSLLEGVVRVLAELPPLVTAKSVRTPGGQQGGQEKR